MTYSIAAKTALVDEIVRAVPFSNAGSPHSTPAVSGGSEVLVSGSPIREAVTFAAPTAADPSVCSMSTVPEFASYNSGTWVPVTPNLFRVYSAATAGIELVEDDATQSLPLSNNATLRQLTMSVTLTGASGTAITITYLQSMHNRALRAGSQLAQLRYLGIGLNGTELSGGTYARVDTNGLWSAAAAAGQDVSSSISDLEFSASVDFAGAGSDYNQYWLASTPSGAPEAIVTTSLQTLVDGQRAVVNPTFTIS